MPGILASLSGTLQNIAELLGLIVIFILVLVACFYTTRFVAGRQLQKKTAGNFELIETYAIAQNKYLQLIRMGEKYVVISVAKDSVEYITELQEEEICRFPRSEPVSIKSFKDVLAGLRKDRQTGDAEKKENSTEARKG